MRVGVLSDIVLASSLDALLLGTCGETLFCVPTAASFLAALRCVADLEPCSPSASEGWARWLVEAVEVAAAGGTGGSFPPCEPDALLLLLLFERVAGDGTDGGAAARSGGFLAPLPVEMFASCEDCSVRPVCLLPPLAPPPEPALTSSFFGLPREPTLELAPGFGTFGC